MDLPGPETAVTVYAPLDEQLREIRLFTLLPSVDFESPLQGHLDHCALGAYTRPYEALSYAWGEPSMIKPVLIVTKTTRAAIHVTRNLDVALRHLRKSDAGRVLWIDALCINQADLRERAHQVTLMRDVYSQCTADILWLGPNPGPSGGDDTEIPQGLMEDGLRLMERLGRFDAVTVDQLASSYEDRVPQERFNAEKLANRVKDGGVVARRISSSRAKKPKWLLRRPQRAMLEAVFTKPAVWRRVWIMQELSCAPFVLLAAGQETLDWDESVARFLGDSPYADAFHTEFGHSFVRPVAIRLFGDLQSIHHQRGITRQVNSRQPGGFESRLFDVLARFRYANATDPRDKVYGLLGLATDAHGMVEVTYENTPAQVFAAVTESLINQSENLDVLCQSPWQIFGDSPARARMPGLPSWGADFELDGEVLLFAQRSIFSAGAPSCQIPCQIEAGMFLRARGVALGRIGPIHQADYASLAANETGVRYDHWYQRDIVTLEWQELYGLALDTLPEPGSVQGDQGFFSTYVTGESLFDAFWRTILTDCVGYPMKRLEPAILKEQLPHLRELLREARARKDLIQETEDDRSPMRLAHGDMSTMWEKNMKRWTFSVTDNGLFVMIVPPARSGDLLVCLDGAKVPLVLRPRAEDGGDAARTLYELVTVAYVHGFMDMEATESIELREKLALSEQEFWLA